MKVIFLVDVPKVGNRYDVKDFKEGYAQNVLLSKGLAELATPIALARLEAKKSQMNKARESEMKAFNELVGQVNNKTVTIVARANEKGHLFKTVSAKDIIDAIFKSSGIKVEEGHVVTGHIKELGTYKIKIKKGDREGNCGVVVVAQK